MSNYSENKMVDDPNHVWNKLANYIPENSTILDIGCSSANFGEALIARKSCTVDGIEPEESDAKVAAKKLRKVWTYNIEDPANVALIKNKYDVIVFADVLEHLVRPAETLKTIKKLLKPNGRVVFSIPNMAHISVRLSLLAGNFSYTETGLLDKTHLHFYNQESIKIMFKEAGMRLSNLDGVIYGYPDALIHKKLNALGLTPTEPGMAILRDPKAAIFQYVGCAQYISKADARSAGIKRNMPVLSQDIQNLVDDLQHCQNEIRELELKNTELVKQIENITASNAYKVGKVVVKPAHKVRTYVERTLPKK